MAKIRSRYRSPGELKACLSSMSGSLPSSRSVIARNVWSSSSPTRLSTSRGRRALPGGLPRGHAGPDAVQELLVQAALAAELGMERDDGHVALARGDGMAVHLGEDVDAGAVIL